MHTPLEIEIGLYYWTRASVDYRDGDFSAPAVREVFDRMMKAGLLTKQGVRAGMTYEPTEALGVWVEGLCAVPWPIQKWVLPAEAA